MINQNASFDSTIFEGFLRNLDEGSKQNEGIVPKILQKISISRNLPSDQRPLYDTPTKYSE